MHKFKYIIVVLILLCSCREHFTPKPKGYFKVDFPQKEFQVYQAEYPFTFEYPVYAKIEKDSTHEIRTSWFNIHYLPFDAKLHVSYKPVKNKQELYELEEDARNLVYKHTVKADAINEDLIKTKNNVYGVFYNIEGNAASVLQFYVTDKSKHYIRCALYFNVKTNRDSLEPMIAFLRSDIVRMINTLQWKN